MRGFRGPLVREKVQTGDGRFITDGAMDHQSLPMPLAWLQRSMHGDPFSNAGGETIGTIATIDRQDDGAIWGTGTIDDEGEHGEAMVRRLEAGTASMGTQMGVSADMDDFVVELLLDWGEGDMFWKSEQVALRTEGVDPGPFIMGASKVRPLLRGLTAAAGDGDPADDDRYELLFEARADEFMERFTRLRMRGATAVDVPAFADCYIELDDSVMDAEPVAAAAARNLELPPAAHFVNPELGGPTPLTITDDRQVFGHGACWGTCHTGYADRCVTAPRASDQYRSFATGEAHDAEGGVHAVGTLVWGIPHGDTNPGTTRAQLLAHYFGDSTKGWADVAVGEDEHGIWVNGHLRNHITDTDIQTLRALKLSGHWVPRPGAYDLDLLAFLAVNVAGFPVPRQLVASAVPTPTAPTVTFDTDGRITALVAAAAPVHQTPGHVDPRLGRALDGLISDQREVLRVMRTLEMRTRHLRGAQAEDIRRRMAREG